MLKHVENSPKKSENVERMLKNVAIHHSMSNNVKKCPKKSEIVERVEKCCSMSEMFKKVENCRKLLKKPKVKKCWKLSQMSTCSNNLQ